MPDKKLILLSIIILAVVVVVLFLDPVPQNPAYHQFADKRNIAGIPNFWNVISNILFLIIGILGIRLIMKERIPGGLAELKTHYLIFFLGVLLTTFGSAYYHYQPDNQTLIWDRLPMSLFFMAFFAAVIGEFIDLKSGRLLLWPLIVIGILSVVYWWYTEGRGAGDLRFYGMVQFIPLCLVPCILISFKPVLGPNLMLWLMIIAYLVAKLFEILDQEIFRILGVVSGHTLKHFIAALAAWFYYLSLQARRPVRK